MSYEDAPAAIAAVWEVAKDWPGWGAWDGETPESVGPALISEIRSALYYRTHHRTHRYCLHSPAHTTSHLSAFIFFYVASLLSADASRAIKRPCRHTAAVIPSGST